MSAFMNLSFEIQGATPGLADGWTLTQSVSWPMAGFTGAAVDGPESFEAGWSADPWETEIDTPLGAVFGVGVVYPAGAPHESFEAAGDGGWDTGYQTVLGGLAGAEFGTGLDDYEGFESEWAPAQAFLTQFVGVGTDLVAAVFDAGGSANAFESFAAADGWDPDYETTVGEWVVAQFDGPAAEGVEDFEQVRFRQAFTVTPSNDFLNAPAHEFALNDRLQVATTSRLPAGLSPEVDYYVTVAYVDSLKVSWELAGAAVDIEDPGSGTHYLVGDVAKFWTEEL